MVQYFDNYDLACVDGYTFRRDKKTGYYLSSKLINGKRKRLHVYIWEKLNGAIPKGYEVHHKDKDKTNNEPDNLELLSKSIHAKYHCDTASEKLRIFRSHNVQEKATPAAREWHKSKEGHEWHVQNGIRVMSNRKPIKYSCTYCGKEFESTHKYGKDQNTFCSNNCKAAYRRKSGVDNVKKQCALCGNEFIANKYSEVKYCKTCQKLKGYPR